MPEKTILMHEDPSKETWNTAGSKIRRRLRDRVEAKNFSLKYRTDSMGTWTLGKIRQGGSRKSGRGNEKGGVGLGIIVEKEF